MLREISRSLRPGPRQGPTAGSEGYGLLMVERTTGEKARFDQPVSEKRFAEVNLIAMRHCVSVAFNSEARCEILGKYFRHLYQANFSTQYRLKCFEIGGYKMTADNGSKQLFCESISEEVEMADGRCIRIVGAAQFFSRFHKIPIQNYLSNRYHSLVLNLSNGDVGPEAHLSGPFISLSSNAALVIVHVLSGRSIGCKEYLGGWMTVRRGQTGQVSREIILREMWENAPQEAVWLIRKRSQRYVVSHVKTAQIIKVSKFPVWFSSLEIEDWSETWALNEGIFGAFPQIVSRREVSQISSFFDAYIEALCLDDIHTFTGRFNGIPCPYMWSDRTERWPSNYYYANCRQEFFDNLHAVFDFRITRVAN